MAIQFNTESLLFKWGFEDGTLLTNFLEEKGFPYEKTDLYFTDNVLVETVRREVIPQIDQEVETYRLLTGHNPIRAHSVDGESIDASDHEHSRKVNDARDRAELTPKTVNVEEQAILGIAHQVFRGEIEGLLSESHQEKEDDRLDDYHEGMLKEDVDFR